MLECIKTKRLSDEIDQRLRELTPYLYNQSNKNLREIIDEYFNQGMIDGLERKMIETKILLNRICNEIEATLKNHSGAEFFASIYFYDDVENRLYLGASPNGMQSLNKAVESLTLSPSKNGTSCEALLYLGEPVIVSDTITDVRWENFRDLAKEFGIRTSWIVPLFYKNKPIGTFVLNASKFITPSNGEIELVIHKAKELQKKLAVIQEDLFRIRNQIYKVEGIVDLDGFLSMINSDFATTFEGQYRWDFIHPEDRKLAVDMWEKVKKGETVHFLYRLKNLFPELGSNKEWVTAEFHWSPIMDDDEVIAGRSVVLFNTPRCIEKEEYIDKYYKFTAITDSTGHVITYVSTGIKEILGIKPTAWMGVKKYVNLHPDDNDRVYATLNQARKLKNTTISVHRFIRPDGEIVTLEAHFSPMFDQTGKVTSMYCEFYQDTPSCQQFNWYINHQTNIKIKRN